jgi:hypothetical protein
VARPLEIGDTGKSWQSCIRLWMDGQNMTADHAASIARVSRATVQRLIALHGNYGRKRWRAKFLNEFMRKLKIPADLRRRVNYLAAIEEGYEL